MVQPAGKDKDASKQVQQIGEENKTTGTRQFKVLGSRFELPSKYDILEPVGSGAYGVVVAAKDNSIEDES